MEVSSLDGTNTSRYQHSTLAPGVPDTPALTAVEVARLLEGTSCPATCRCHRTAGDGHGATHCPIHDDASPSATVNPGTTQGFVAHCQTCGDQGQDALIAEIRRRAGLGSFRPRPHRPRPLAPTPPSVVKPPKVAVTGKRRVGDVQRFRGETPAGQVAIHCRQNVVLTLADGAERRDKEVWWEQPNGTKSLPAGTHTADYLYAPGGLARIPEGATVDLHEGEPAADAGAALGRVSVALVCGAGATPSPAVLDWLAARRVYLYPDNDEPGDALMRRTAAGILERGGAPRWVAPLPDAAPKDDLADYQAAGGTAEGLARRIAAAPCAFTVVVNAVRAEMDTQAAAQLADADARAHQAARALADLTELHTSTLAVLNNPDLSLSHRFVAVKILHAAKQAAARPLPPADELERLPAKAQDLVQAGYRNIPLVSIADRAPDRPPIISEDTISRKVADFKKWGLLDHEVVTVYAEVIDHATGEITKRPQQATFIRVQGGEDGQRSPYAAFAQYRPPKNTPRQGGHHPAEPAPEAPPTCPEHSGGRLIERRAVHCAICDHLVDGPWETPKLYPQVAAIDAPAPTPRPWATPTPLYSLNNVEDLVAASSGDRDPAELADEAVEWDGPFLTVVEAPAAEPVPVPPRRWHDYREPQQCRCGVWLPKDNTTGHCGNRFCTAAAMAGGAE